MICRQFIRLILIILLNFSLIYSGRSETRIEAKNTIYASFGNSIVNIKDLNSKLESLKYPKMSDRFVSAGGGIHAVSDGLVIGGEGHRISGEKTESKDYETSISIFYGFFYLGHSLYSTENLILYPSIGIGAGRFSLKILEKGHLTFDEVLKGPKRSTRLSIGGLLINPSLGFDYLLSLRKTEKEISGIVIGLRIGYIFAPVKGNWAMEGIKTPEGPKMGITGPYIRLIIGSGGINYDKS